MLDELERQKIWMPDELERQKIWMPNELDHMDTHATVYVFYSFQINFNFSWKTNKWSIRNLHWRNQTWWLVCWSTEVHRHEGPWRYLRTIKWQSLYLIKCSGSQFGAASIPSSNPSTARCNNASAPLMSRTELRASTTYSRSVRSGCISGEFMNDARCCSISRPIFSYIWNISSAPRACRQTSKKRIRK